MSLILALLLQVGPNPLAGAIAGDELVRDRPPRAEANAGSTWFEACFDQIEADPARAHTTAQIRRSETTGADRVLANHCLGTAAAALGLWDDARAAFIAAHDETPADEQRTRARFAALAGNAALAGGDAAGALDLLALAESDARAVSAASLGAIAATDRARALVILGRGDEALAALEAATTLAPERSEGWLLKATLLRRLERLDEAQGAIERAALLTPDNPEIGLEAGVIAVLAGRDAAARASWESVIAIGPGPAAETAQEYLAQLGPAAETPPATPQPQELQP
ncbi:MAG: tetratricopeptide repeat protein [Erythrobacter sp.]|nr:tetratricopeptide repeat protein [Erythrobacter sp.]